MNIPRAPFAAAPALASGQVTAHDLAVRHRRLLPGVHVSSIAQLSPADRVGAVALWAPDDAVIVGHAAALLHGERFLAPEATLRAVEVAHPTLSRPPRGVTVRRLRRPIPAEHLTTVDGIHVTTPARTAVDCARWTKDIDERIVAVDSVCNATSTTLSEVDEATRSMRGLHGVRAVSEVLPWCDPRADSPPETRMRLLIGRSSLPTPEVQVVVNDEYGYKVTTADLGYRQWKVAVFYDGEHHLEWRHRDWDAGATAQLHELGWATLRVTAGMLCAEKAMLRQLAGLLRQQGAPV